MQPPNFLEWQFYHNSVEAWAIAGTVFVVIGAVLFIARTMLARRLAKVAAKTATTADDAIVDLLRRTRYFFIITAAVAGATLFLELPPRALAVGRLLGTIALFVQMAIWGNGLITFWFRNYAERKADSDLSAVRPSRRSASWRARSSGSCSRCWRSPDSGTTSRRSLRVWASAASRSRWPCRTCSGISSPRSPSCSTNPSWSATRSRSTR
jgi:hypothetical protein